MLFAKQQHFLTKKPQHNFNSCSTFTESELLSKNYCSDDNPILISKKTEKLCTTRISCFNKKVETST